MQIRRFLLILLVCCSTAAVADQSVFTLWESKDAKLQNRLEHVIKKLGLWRQVKNKHLAISLVDITDIKSPKLATVNGNEMVYAASLPKIAILLGAFVEIEQGELKPDAKLWQDMTQMIRFSNNQAATRVLDLVGHERVLDILQEPRFSLYDAAHNGGLWVGKAYGRAPAFHRDPMHNISHGATAMQAAQFYFLLETGKLVSPELTLKMKEILSKPAIKHKFVKGLAGRPEVKIYRKSGSWKQFHADSALVESGKHKFIIVGLAENRQGGQWLTQLAAPLYDLVVGKQIASIAN
jgi:beta-lactamase class A